MADPDIQAHCQLDADSEALLEQAMAQHAFSARPYARILDVARTSPTLLPSTLSVASAAPKPSNTPIVRPQRPRAGSC